MPETFREGENGLSHTYACVYTMLMFASIHLELSAFTACKIPQKSLKNMMGKVKRLSRTDGQKEDGYPPLSLKTSPGMTALWMETGHLSGGWGSCIAGIERDTRSSKAYFGQKQSSSY